MSDKTSVLIVGGSLNGLAAALFLAQRGIGCIVVERHPATTVQYKFAGISPRSMEIFRGAGVEQQIRENRTGDQKAGEITRARNLADPNVQFLGKPWADMTSLGAASAETCDQDRLEPILRAAAEHHGADVRFHSELLDIEQDARSVRGRVRSLDSRQEYDVEAAYLLAADGIGGETRERVGIARSGPGVLQHWMNLIFATDLEPYIQGRRFTSCFVTDLNASVTPRAERWLLSLQYQPEKGERPDDFDARRTAELVRLAAGREDIKADLYDARPWDVAAYLAERFRAGRTFLLGDAAHSMPPTGGFGGNTGIHDAHNLAWKLELVLRGAARPDLLDSYDAERRFTAERTLDQSLARLSAWFEDPSKKLPPPAPLVADEAVIFGYVYPRGAIVMDAPPGDAFDNPRTPSGRPGSRAPHFELDDGECRTAVHDQFGRGFVLLTAGEGAWQAAAAACRRRFAADLRCIVVEGPAASERFATLYGVAPGGAALVRPDGHIAWRSREPPADGGDELAEALTALGLLPSTVK